MTVYVDDAAIPATVPNGAVTHTSRWCHLIADEEEELHAFALRLGLRRSYFQAPRGFGGLPAVPSSRAAQNWHYDVTAGKRAQAVRLGAVQVTTRELSEIIDARYLRRFPDAAQVYFEGRRATSEKWAAERAARGDAAAL